MDACIILLSLAELGAAGGRGFAGAYDFRFGGLQTPPRRKESVFSFELAEFDAAIRSLGDFVTRTYPATRLTPTCTSIASYSVALPDR